MRFVTSVVFIIVLIFISGLSFAQDPTKVAPESYKTILENEQVRVCEVHLKPGGKIPSHSHPSNVHYFVKDGKLKITNEDGTAQELDIKAGNVFWFDPLIHSVENVGTTEIHAVVFELKKEGPKE